MAIKRPTRPKSRYITPTTESLYQTQTRLLTPRGLNEEASAVILTAQKAEYDEVVKHLTTSPIVTEQCEDQPYKKGEFSSDSISWEVYVAKIGPRSDIAARRAKEAIDCFEPKIILFVGTACGLDREVLKYGHVVVVEKAYDVEAGSESPEFEPVKPLRVQSSTDHVVAIAKKCIQLEQWKQRIQEKIGENEPVACLGSVATTHKVVKSNKSPTFQRIKEHWGDRVVALEMEGYGFLQQTSLEKTWAIMIRGISDFGENKTRAEQADSKKCAMLNASAFTFELLANISLAGE